LGGFIFWLQVIESGWVIVVGQCDLSISGLDTRLCWIFDVFPVRSGTEATDGDGEDDEGGWEGDG
jgi:hypothetical protein